MAITVSIAQIQILQQDATLLRSFVVDQPGKNKKLEAAAQRLEEFAAQLLGIDVQIQV